MCNELLELEGIRSAFVISMKGSILFSSYKDEIQPLLSRQEYEAFLFKAAIRMGTRKEFLEKLGGINYAFAEYGKINQYTIPLDKEVKTLLLISEDKLSQNSDDGRHHNNNNTSSSSIDRIMKILRKYGMR